MFQTENKTLKEEASRRDPGAAAAEQELQELHAEFTKRLGVAEKTVQQMNATPALDSWFMALTLKCSQGRHQ